MNRTLKRLEVIIEGETVRFRETPYGKWIVGCSCLEYYCRHRTKASSCDLTGNESRDYLQTRTEGTSLTALLGVADSGAIKLLRDQQRWKIAQAKAAQQINTKP